MQAFFCSTCSQLLFFDNFTCLRCGAALGYDPARGVLGALVVDVDGFLHWADGHPGRYRRCSNQEVARCNWLVGDDEDDGLCQSCRLTAVRPNDTETDAIAAFADAEAAKRRLLRQLRELELDVIDRTVDEARGVAFEFLSSRNQQVMTGHEDGVITLDLSESDDVHREFVRQQLGEPYRTVLGHLRHEIGHYFWPRLVVERGHLDEFRRLFGTETISYQDALAQHYADGGGADGLWVDTYVSQYATMHPWEDWAETFAHYLHIDAGLRTAEAFGLRVERPSMPSVGVPSGAVVPDVGSMIDAWLAMSQALNAMSRAIGQHDLYPFVLSGAVVSKLDFVHRVVTRATTR